MQKIEEVCAEASLMYRGVQGLDSRENVHPFIGLVGGGMH